MLSLLFLRKKGDLIKKYVYHTYIKLKVPANARTFSININLIIIQKLLHHQKYMLFSGLYHLF